MSYFSLTTNQPAVLSAMAYQPSEQGIACHTLGMVWLRCDSMTGGHRAEKVWQTT